MPRAYPPIWCKTYNCKKCNIIECNSKVLTLLMPFKDPQPDFIGKVRKVEVTSIAIYLGYCQRLAKFFLLFPQDSPVPVIQRNFINAETGLPTKVSIQRIFLDMLNQGDPEAPTDDVHRFRILLMLNMVNAKRGRISDADKIVDVKPSKEELEQFVQRVKKWRQDLYDGNIANFEKTSVLERCRYCFLENCEQI